MLLNRIKPEILRKNKNTFQRNQYTTSQILTIPQIIEGVCAKHLEAKLLFIDSSKTFDSLYTGNMEQILLAYDLPKENVTTIKIHYKNTKEMIWSPNGNPDCFKLVTGVLQRDTWEYLLYRLELATRGISLYEKADKIVHVF